MSQFDSFLTPSTPYPAGIDPARLKEQHSPTQPITPQHSHEHQTTRKLSLTEMDTSETNETASTAAVVVASELVGRRSSSRAKSAVNYNENDMDDIITPLDETTAGSEETTTKSGSSSSALKESTLAPPTKSAAPAAASNSFHSFFSPRLKPISAPNSTEKDAVTTTTTTRVVVSDGNQSDASSRSRTPSPSTSKTKKPRKKKEKKEEAATATTGTPTKAKESKKRKAPSKKKEIANSTTTTTTVAPGTPPTKRMAVGDDASKPIVLSVSPTAVDLTQDTTSPVPISRKLNNSTLSTPAVSSKIVHPFFSAKPKKSISAKPESEPEQPIVLSSESPIVVNSQSPDLGPLPSTSSPSLTPATPAAPIKCELDSIYSCDKLPKPEFFMSKKEKIQVRSEKAEKRFLESIEAEKLERRQLIQSFEQSGKQIHPFLRPKPITKIERVASSHANGSTIPRESSPYAGVQFLPDKCTPAFPPDYSHIPIDFESAAAEDGGRIAQVDLMLSGRLGEVIHFMTNEEINSLAHPLPIDQRHYTMISIQQLYGLLPTTPTSPFTSLSPSLPLWSRPTTYPSVNYLTAPQFRSSDVTLYLAQPKVQSFLKDFHEKLKVKLAVSGSSVSSWNLDQIMKQVRRFFIRRVHCFRAAQRDEQLKQQRQQQAADRQREEAGDSAPATSSASSRSDRAASRNIKNEVAEVAQHQDEQIDHAFHPRPDSLWTEQYRAFRSEEMFDGNSQQRTQVKDWLKSWSLKQKNDESQSSSTTTTSAPVTPTPSKSSKSRRKRYEIWSDESDFEEWEQAYEPSPAPPTSSSPVELSNTILLVGPPCGKTSLIYACCHESDTGVIEISNTERRSQRDVLAKCEEATQSHRLAMKTVAAGTNLLASIQRLPSPIKVKRLASPVKKKETTKEKEAAPAPKVAKPLFGFFDSAAKKKEAVAAAKKKEEEEAAKKTASQAASTPASSSATSSAPAAAPMSKREARKALLASKTKSVQVAVKGMPEDLPSESDEEEEVSTGKKRKQPTKPSANTQVDATAFFANPTAFKKTKLNTGTAQPAVLDPLAPVTAVSSQSTIVFEEIDHIFHAHDKKFLFAVRTLISNAKRPIILTCNEITDEIQHVLLAPQMNQLNSISVIESITFQEPKTMDILPYIYLICLVECGCHSIETQSNIPTLDELESLLIYFNNDIRKTLLFLQLRLNSIPLTQFPLGSLATYEMSQSNTNTMSKKRLAQLKLYSPFQTSSQDLILANLGLLSKKEELLTTFQIQLANESTSSSKSAPASKPAKAVASGATDSSASDPLLHLAQFNTFTLAQTLDLQLFHLNYLSTLIRQLSKSPKQADGANSSSMNGLKEDLSLFKLLPLRLTVIPKTAEELFPLNEIQLTPELLAVQPNLQSDSNGDQPTPEPTNTPTAAVVDSPVVPAASSPDVVMSDAPMPVGINLDASLTAAATVSDTPPTATDLNSSRPLVLSAIEEENSQQLSQTEPSSSPEINPKKKSKLIDDSEMNEDNENDQVDIDMSDDPVAVPADDAPDSDTLDANEDGEAEYMADQEVEVLGVKRLTPAQKRFKEMTDREEARKLQIATNQLRRQQKLVIQEELIQAEETKRAAELIKKRKERSINSIEGRCLHLLDTMASLADDLSSMNIYSQPYDTHFLGSSNLYSRSFSRYHPSLHSEVTSATRDYFPIYLEGLISSANWSSLEQQQHDGIDAESADYVDKESKSQDITKQLTLTSAKDSRPFDEIDELDLDLIHSNFDLTREMAGSAEVQSMRVLQAEVDQFHSNHSSQSTDAALTQSFLIQPTMPAVPFPFYNKDQQLILPNSTLTTQPTSSTVTPATIATADHPIVIDSQESDAGEVTQPAPIIPATSTSQPSSATPAFNMISLDPLGATCSKDSIEIVHNSRSDSSLTRTDRLVVSELALELWDKLDSQQHAFNSSAFFCDIFPQLRSLIFDAIDSSAPPPPTINPVDDSVLAQSLADAMEDESGGRSTRRRATRSTKQITPVKKLSRRWSHLTNVLSKSSELITRLQTSIWKEKQQRPLQLEHIWKETIRITTQ